MLRDLVVSCTPKGWDGDAWISIKSGRLYVNQSPAVHAEIARLLARLEGIQ